MPGPTSPVTRAHAARGRARRYGRTAVGPSLKAAGRRALLLAWYARAGEIASEMLPMPGTIRA
jgi:hypothetical protein